MNNPRMTAKDRNLIKGAIRRVFSRSDLHKDAMTKVRVQHFDSNRPRVKTWYQCPSCKGYFAGYQMNVDHISPIVKTTLTDMTWDEVIDAIWCEASNLRAICLTEHKQKSKLEKEERKKNKKGLK